MRSQVAVGGMEAGGLTVGAGVPVGAAVAVGAAVGVGVGAGVGVGVGLGVAVGVALGVAEGAGVAAADGAAEALGLADGWATADGRISWTWVAPDRVWRVTTLPPYTTRPTPWKAAMIWFSWAISSSGHAIWVRARSPMTTASSLSV